MPNIRERLLIGATPKQVYAALTTEKGLSSWWTHNTKASPEQNTIGKFAFKPPYVKEMKIAELEPEKRVVWKCQRGADEWVGTTLSFDLEGGDKQSLLKMHPEMSDQVAQQPDNTPVTLLAFSHDDWKDYTPMFAECSYTWGRFLRGLKLLCETGKGLPWPEQHRVSNPEDGETAQRRTA